MLELHLSSEVHESEVDEMKAKKKPHSGDQPKWGSKTFKSIK